MAGEYHSKDFEWEDLRDQVENDPSLHYHLTPFDPSSPPSPIHSSALDSEAWRDFHRRHSSGRFFKERRYLLKEFPEMVDCSGDCTVLEVGCGNGSTVLPILRARKDISVHACDCSADALEMAKEMVNALDGVSIRDRFHPFLLDFSVSRFPCWLFCNACQLSSRVWKQIDFPGRVEAGSVEQNAPLLVKRSKCCLGGVDFVTLIFTLSAMPFRKMHSVVMECYSVLKPGSLLFFRDYGLYDMTMLRFRPKQRVGFREYMRSDGTLSYFFSLDVIRDLFLNAGFTEIELEYCCIRTINHHNGKEMRRVWVHGKFQKPTREMT